MCNLVVTIYKCNIYNLVKKELQTPNILFENEQDWQHSPVGMSFGRVQNKKPVANCHWLC